MIDIESILNFRENPTTLASACYVNMFAGCTALVHAPILPVVSLSKELFKFTSHTDK